MQVNISAILQFKIPDGLSKDEQAVEIKVRVDQLNFDLLDHIAIIPHPLRYEYHYFTDEEDRDGIHLSVPLQECPVCSYDLTSAYGVELVLSINGRIEKADSRLHEGRLQDTEAFSITKGFYSRAHCANCLRPLDAIRGVIERKIEH